jgi:hypothetical protein
MPRFIHQESHPHNLLIIMERMGAVSILTPCNVSLLDIARTGQDMGKRWLK